MTVKCENCGATLQQDREKAIAFCPYCGFAVKQPEDLVDLAKFTMKHEEEVRQRKVQEEQKSNKMALYICIGLLIAGLLTTGIMTWKQKSAEGNEDQKMQATVERVQQLMLDGNYDAALIEAQTIRVEKQGILDDHYAKWENQRKDLIRLIEQKQKESK